MGINFPSAPITGQKYLGYTYDGIAWLVTPPAALSPAPFDALGWSGMQINGSMEVSQEIAFGVGGIVLSSGGAYFCDGWVHFKSAGSAAGTVQAATAAAGGAYFPANSNFALVNIATSQGSFSGGEQFWVGQYIEGYRIRRLGFGTANAQSLTLGFWTAHSQTGTFTGTIRNYSGARSCAFSYVQSAANVAQYNTVTIPGCTDGTWPMDNTPAMIVTFSIAAGATMIAPSSGVWHAANYTAGPGQINGASTVGNFRLTGVVVLPGTQAPSAARSPLIMRPYDQELITCMRYWQQLGKKFSGRCESATRASGVMALVQIMRAAPTVSLVAANAANALVSNTTLYTVTGISGASPAPDSIYFAADVSPATLVLGQAVTGFANNWIACDARL